MTLNHQDQPEAATTSRRGFLRGTFITAAAVISGGLPEILHAATSPWHLEPDKPIIPAPVDPALWPAYRDELARWRKAALRDLHYDDSLYRKPQFAWSASAYACCLLMMCDQSFYDPKAAQYRVEAMLDEGVREFGGYDSVVLWHAYPRIGVDERNQFDFYRDMPGGLPGVRETVRQMHARGVYVYIDYNPWDTGTRREGKSDLDAIAELVHELEVDGIFLDTMKEGAAAFRQKLDLARPGVVLEGEVTPPRSRLGDHHASWAQWFDDSEVPGVLSLKWLERRHMQHQVARWNLSHAAELQTAWMNGSGMMVWENVFGSWVPWSAHDRSVLRAILPIQRRFSAIFRGEGWIPLVPVECSGIFASLWTDGTVRLWTLVNRTDAPVDGTLLRVETLPNHEYYDLVGGHRLDARGTDESFLLGAEIPARGVACFLSAPSSHLGKDFPEFLRSQTAVALRADWNSAHPSQPTLLKPYVPTVPATTAPPGMVPVKPGQGYMYTGMRARECGFYETYAGDESLRGSNVYQTRDFLKRVPSQPYAIDETPVTNEQFAAFLAATKYRPASGENFLKHWTEGKPPAGKLDHPVVWVDLDDARAFAAWQSKRLPTEEEWQYAAQGVDGREYPWSGGMRSGRCNLGETSDTTPVKAFPAGRSPAGCYDMCGNVWHWTESERSDGHTRSSIIRGGAYFAAAGSHWYVDGGPRPASFATKFLHMWPGLDRCATIGFRCVVDLAR